MVASRGMSEAELAELQALGAGRDVLELGAYRGASTLALAAVARSLCSVDHHLGDETAGHRDTGPDYLQNLTQAGLRERVVAIFAPFDLCLALLAPSAFDLVFVDGAHDQRSVLHDLAQALRLCRPLGQIAFHDWGRHEVKKALLPRLGHPPRLCESLACWPNPAASWRT